MLLIIYAAILVSVVLLGAHIHRLMTLSHTRVQLMMSFVSGIMLGIAIFHLLPHALYAGTDHVSVDTVAIWLMVGLVSMFLLQRVFHFHHHDYEEESEHHHEGGHSNGHNDHSHGGSGWGMVLGLTIHSLLDGVALAASMQADFFAAGNTVGMLAGIGVFVAILLHKPLDAMTISLFMHQADMSSGRRWLVLTGYALLCPLMAGFVMLGFTGLDMASPAYLAAALAFSAGIFLCIALSDLLPEIHFHSHDRFKMTVVLLTGIFLSLAIKHIESEQSHKLHLNHISHQYSSGKNIDITEIC